MEDQLQIEFEAALKTMQAMKKVFKKVKKETSVKPKLEKAKVEKTPKAKAPLKIKSPKIKAPKHKAPKHAEQLPVH